MKEQTDSRIFSQAEASTQISDITNSQTWSALQQAASSKHQTADPSGAETSLPHMEPHQNSSGMDDEKQPEEMNDMEHRLVGPFPSFAELLAQLDPAKSSFKHRPGNLNLKSTASPVILHSLSTKPTSIQPVGRTKQTGDYAPTIPKTTASLVQVQSVRSPSSVSQPEVALAAGNENPNPTQNTSLRRNHPLIKTSTSHKLPTKQGDKQVSTQPSISDSHDFNHDYLALVPSDQTQIWHTQFAFTLDPKEQTMKGIQTRLLSFIPTVVAKNRGNILPWDPDSELNPIRDLHTVCNNELFPKYFKFQLLADRKIRGSMKFKVYSNSFTFNYIKHKVDIVSNAFRQYPIYWTNSAITSTETATPLFLVGISKSTNIRQLTKDLISQTGISFPIDLTRRVHEARGYAEADTMKQNKITIRVPVIKVSCARMDTTELKEKFYSSLGAGVAFTEELQYSALPFAKVMSTWNEDPWTEQL